MSVHRVTPSFIEKLKFACFPRADAYPTGPATASFASRVKKTTRNQRLKPCVIITKTNKTVSVDRGRGEMRVRTGPRHRRSRRFRNGDRAAPVSAITIIIVPLSPTRTHTHVVSQRFPFSFSLYTRKLVLSLFLSICLRYVEKAGF